MGGSDGSEGLCPALTSGPVDTWAQTVVLCLLETGPVGRPGDSAVPVLTRGGSCFAQGAAQGPASGPGCSLLSLQF